MTGEGLFAQGGDWLARHVAVCTRHGLPSNPTLSLHRGSGLLCYYSRTDGQIYLSIPEEGTPLGGG